MQAAHAQQPPDPANSDANFNTAVGSNALKDLISNSTSGDNNTAIGDSALEDNTSGQWDTAIGSLSLQLNSTGMANSAFGYNALNSNTTGGYNTACGFATLQYNNTGSYNTAHGSGALYFNSSGSDNTSSGFNSLAYNTTGSDNTALGYNAALYNSAGTLLTALGEASLQANTTGSYNSGFGAYSLVANTTGVGNTAGGYTTLRSVTTGNYNVGIGYQTLFNATTGSSNIGIGYRAGFNVSTGSYAIEIGNQGSAGDTQTIRIGTEGAHLKAFIAGVSGTQVTGAAVYVTSSGQLGVLASSERYKTAIESLGSDTDKLMQLRPVSYHLKTDPQGAVQYGLIAEEVDKVYPELVIRDDSGKIQGVRYEELTPMLLNEMKKQQQTIAAQTAHAAAQDQEIEYLKKMVLETQAGLAKLEPKNALVAQR
jgi:hypothetical protein